MTEHEQVLDEIATGVTSIIKLLDKIANDNAAVNRHEDVLHRLSKLENWLLAMRCEVRDTSWLERIEELVIRPATKIESILKAVEVIIENQVSDSTLFRSVSANRQANLLTRLDVLEARMNKQDEDSNNRQLELLAKINSIPK